MEEGSDDLERQQSEQDVVDMVMPDETDRISQLPNQVIHHILSLLPERDVARSSVLSKTWHGIWASFPISNFDFSESSFPFRLKTYTRKERQDRDMKIARFVHDSVLRQHRLNTNIQRFKLLMSNRLDPVVASHINKSLQMVIDCNVQELDLSLIMECGLPPTIFSAKDLTVLRLAHSSLTTCPNIDWPSLRQLSLYAVVIDRQLIQNLNSTCPLLEKFSMVRCSGFKSITLSGLRNLKKAKLKFEKRGDCVVEKIEVNIPNLQILNFHGQCQIDVAACRKLQILKLKSPTIKGRVCQDIVSKLHELKILVLCCPLLKKINISNKQLERLQFSSNSLQKATIHTPVLQSLKYNFNAIRFPFLMDKTSLWKVTMKFSPDLDLHSFCRLREHLINFNQIQHLTRLTLHINSTYIRYSIPKHFDVNPLPEMPDIKQLKLKIGTSWMLWFNDRGELERNYADLVDCLLWMCHPESLLLMSGWAFNNEFMKVLCRKLMRRQREQHCCTSSKFKRCWNHDLKDVEIEHHKGNGVKVTLTCAALLALLQSGDSLAPREKIFFIFRW